MKSTLRIVLAAGLLVAMGTMPASAVFNCTDFADTSVADAAANATNNCGISFPIPPTHEVFLALCGERGENWARQQLTDNSAVLDKCITNWGVRLRLNLERITIQGGTTDAGGAEAFNEATITVNYSVKNIGRGTFEVESSPKGNSTNKRNYLVTIKGSSSGAGDEQRMFTAEDHLHNVIDFSSAPGKSLPGHIPLQHVEQAYGQVHIDNFRPPATEQTAMTVDAQILFRGDKCYLQASSTRIYECTWTKVPPNLRKADCSPHSGSGQDTSHFGFARIVGQPTHENGCTQFLERLR